MIPRETPSVKSYFGKDANIFFGKVAKSLYIKKRLHHWRFPEEFYKIFKGAYLEPYQTSMMELFCDI